MWLVTIVTAPFMYCLRLCIWYGHPDPLYPFVLVPARTCTSIQPSTQHLHNTAINVISSRRQVGQPLGSADCLQHYPYSYLSSTILRACPYSIHCLPVLYTLRLLKQCNILLFFNSSVRYVYKNSSGDEIANVNFYAVRPEATWIRWNNAK